MKSRRIQQTELGNWENLPDSLLFTGGEDAADYPLHEQPASRD